MSTSNSIDFTVTTNEIITEALELLGVLGEGQSPTADQVTSSQRTLNMMAKTWQADGLNLFAVERAYLFPEKKKKEYELFKPSVAPTVTTPGLQNIRVNSVEDESTIDIQISGSGKNRKVLLSVRILSQPIFTPSINGINATSVLDFSEASVEVYTWEWLDADLPSEAGTYTIDTSASNYALNVLSADGFTQQTASSTNTFSDSATSFSVTVTPTTSDFLVFSSIATAKFSEINGTIPAGQLQVSDTGNVDSHYAAYYSTNGIKTHTYDFGSGQFGITIGAASHEVSGVTVNSSGDTRYVTDFYELTIAADALQGDTVITVEDDSELEKAEDGDIVGIHSSNNTIFWTAANFSGTTMTLGAPLPSDVSSGTGIYGYTFETDATNRPMIILEAYNKIFNATEIPVEMISRVDYHELTNKETEGFINQAYYDPQLNRGKVFLWPTANDEKDYMIFLVQRTLDDFDNTSDTPDYPQEWYMPLAVNLAKYLAPKYGTPQMDYSRVLQQARELYEMARGFDTEMGTSMFIRPDSMRGNPV